MRIFGKNDDGGLVPKSTTIESLEHRIIILEQNARFERDVKNGVGINIGGHEVRYYRPCGKESNGYGRLIFGADRENQYSLHVPEVEIQKLIKFLSK